MSGEGRTPTLQAVLMTMLGRYCLADNPAISTQGYIEVLTRIGVSPQASRLTLSRMTERGLLERLRRGRLAYFRSTEVGLTVMRNQEERTFHDQGGAPGDQRYLPVQLSHDDTSNKRGLCSVSRHPPSGLSDRGILARSN